MTDPRIGKRGEYAPTQTISGLPAERPFITVAGLDSDNVYYVVIDTFPQVDVTATLDQLKKQVTDGRKRTSAKTDETE
jgi:hypothetical protein